MPEFAERVVFSVAIVYSETLYGHIRDLDQHAVVALLCVVFALLTTHLATWWEKHDEENCCTFHKIITSWLDVGKMVFTFLAIHSVVDTIDETIRENERFYFDSILFPIVTLLSAIALLTITQAHFFDTKED